MFIYWIACFAFGDAFYTASKYHKKYKNNGIDVFYNNYV